MHDCNFFKQLCGNSLFIYISAYCCQNKIICQRRGECFLLPLKTNKATDTSAPALHPDQAYQRL